jgi:RNA polymerase sigma-70 factor, ECF subfamily
VPTQQQLFEEVAMPHVAALLRVARRLTFDRASAEDLVQETMLLAWRGFRGFRPGTNARAWLFRILFNAFHGAGRKSRPELRTLPGATSVPAMLQEAAEIAEAVDTLPVEQRTVLMLCVVEGFTSRETAESWMCPWGQSCRG